MSGPSETSLKVFRPASLVFVPASCTKSFPEVPSAAKEEFGFAPTYIPAVATETQSSFKLDWGGEVVQSNVAYARTVENGRDLIKIDEIGNLEEVNAATILHLLHKRFVNKLYLTHSGKYCDIWVNPLRQAPQNSISLMRWTRSLCAEHGYAGVSAITEQISKRQSADSSKILDALSHPLMPVYMKLDDIFENLKQVKVSQTVCFRGQSGSGKSALYSAALQYTLYRNSVISDKSEEEAAGNDGEFISMQVSSKFPFDLHFSSSPISRSVVAGLHVQNAFGTVAAGSSSEFSDASKALTTARIVFAENNQGHLYAEKVIFALHCLDTGRIKPFKRTNMPPNMESIRMPYKILHMFLASIANDQAKQAQYSLKPAEIALYLSENVVGSAAVGMADIDGNFVTGTVQANEEEVNWARDFLKLKRSLFEIGMEESKWEEICNVLSCVCHMQMVGIVGVDNAVISATSKAFITSVETQLGLQSGDLLKLISKKVERNKFTVVDSKAVEARAVCDAIAFEIYKRLTSYLLAFCSNGGLNLTKSTGTLVANFVDLPPSNGIIDGIGKGNNLDTCNHNSVPYRSFKEFCSNYALEKLHVIYVDECFNNEVHKYRNENVVLEVDPNLIPKILKGSTVFTDIFESTAPQGFIQMLEEVSVSSKPEDKTFQDNILKMQFMHPKTGEQLVSGSKQKAGMKGFRAGGFLVTHSFGTVHYDAESFAYTNKSQVLFGTEESVGSALLESGSISVIKRLTNAGINNALDNLLSADDSRGAEKPSNESGDSAVTAGVSKGRAFSTANCNPKHFAFRMEQNSINLAMSVLFSTSWENAVVNNSNAHIKPKTHFFVCIRPAPSTALIGLPPMLPLRMDVNSVDTQIRAALLPELGQLYKIKFAEPSRTFQEFYDRFKLVVPYHWHSVEAQKSMQQQTTFRDLHDVSSIASAMMKNNVQNVAAFKCDAKYAKKLLERICEYINKCESDENNHFKLIGSMAPQFGITTIFLPKVLHRALEKYREHTLRQIHRYSVFVQKQLRMIAAKKFYRGIRRSIIVLQANFRMRRFRAEYKLSRERVSFIKSKLMMLVARSKFRRMKVSANLIKNWTQQKLVRIRFSVLKDNLLYVHQLAKGAVIRHRTLLVIAQVQKLQRCAKRFLRRCRYLALINRSATCIQSQFRGWSNRLLNAAMVAHLRREKLKRAKNKAALKIQSVYRTFLVKSRKSLVERSAVVLQKWGRQIKAKSEYARMLWLVQWVQKQSRCKLANNRINRLRERKMLQDAAFQVAVVKEKELEYAFSKSQSDLSLGSASNGDGLTLTTMNILSIDVHEDISLAYPEGWLASVMRHVDAIYTEGGSKKSLTKISLGSHHTVLLDDMSNVYTFGLGDGGQLGHGNRLSLARPQVMDKLRQILASSERSKDSSTPSSPMGGLRSGSFNSGANIVRDISCGREHTLLLTSSGRVWSWGSNKFGQLGHSNFESCAIPRQVTAGTGAVANQDHGSMSSISASAFKQIKQISAGGYHSAAITESGSLYTWGARAALGRKQGESGNIQSHMHGFNSLSAYQANKRQNRVQSHKNDCEPGMPPFFCVSIRIPIAQVVCGDAHITVKCETNVRNSRTGVELYAWGGNSYGQLGVGSDEPVIYEPTRVKLPAVVIETVNAEAKDVPSGASKKPVEATNVAAYGVNAKPAKTGNPAKNPGNEKDGEITRLLYTEVDMKNAVLVTGGRHMLLALKGDIWAWGWNQFGQIGNDSDAESAPDTSASNPSALKTGTNKSGLVLASKHSKCAGINAPKRIWAQGTVNSNKEMRTYIKSVAAGWRYSAAVSYVSAASAASTSKKQKNGSGLYMWGAVQREGNFLCKDGANLVISALFQEPSSESKPPETSDIANATHSTNPIKESNSFAGKLKHEMQTGLPYSDDESDTSADTSGGNASISGHTNSETRNKFKSNMYEEDPVLVPTLVNLPSESLGVLTAVAACSSSAFSVTILTSKQGHDLRLQKKSGSMSPTKSATSASIHVKSPSSPRRVPMPPWHKSDSPLGPVSFKLDQSAISSQFKMLKQSFVPGASRLTASDLGCPKDKAMHRDEDSLTDDAKSVRSYTSGKSGDRSVASGQSKHGAAKKAERKLILAKMKTMELRAREKKMDPSALLALFAPQIFKQNSPKPSEKNGGDVFGIESNDFGLSESKRRKNVVFTDSETPDSPNAEELFSEASSSNRGFLTALDTKKEFRATKGRRGSAPMLMGDLSSLSLRDEEPDKADNQVLDFFSNEQTATRPAHATSFSFDHRSRQSPAKGGSPMRLSAVRDLAGLIEQIRSEAQ